MTTRPHIIVLGLGIVGSSITATLASRGFRVTGIEQFSPLHDRGSSHGDTRIYRRVPHEGEVYVKMAEASFAGWHAWNRLAGEDLFLPCGGIDAGPDESPMVRAAESLCRHHEQPFERMSGSGFNRKFPHFNLPSEWQVVYQPSSGIVRPDATRTFLHARARQSGATLLHSTPVLGIESHSSGVRVTTANQTIDGHFLIVAAGSWLTRLMPELGLSLSTERRVMAWHRPLASENLATRQFPIFILDFDGGWYGMPTTDGRIKIGHDKHLRQQIDPTQPPIAPNAEDLARLAPCAPRYLRGFEPAPSEAKSCIYTLTPDHHFVIDQHPQHDNVILFSCCSGHGFKFAPVYGEIAAAILNGQPWDGLEQFQLKRTGGIAVTRYSA